MTKLAGINDMANITQIATTTSALLLNLKHIDLNNHKLLKSKIKMATFIFVIVCMIYNVGNPGLGLGQAQKYGRVKPVNRISTPFS
jgi:hypothetical protein